MISRIVVLAGASLNSEIYTDAFHHYYIGLALVFIAVISKKMTFFAIGTGLIIDEVMLPVHLLGQWNKDYWEFTAILPVLLALVAFLVFFRPIVKFFKLNTHE